MSPPELLENVAISTLGVHKGEFQLGNSATVGCGVGLVLGFFSCWAGLDHFHLANGGNENQPKAETSTRLQILSVEG